jgi:tight adherence protein C
LTLAVLLSALAAATSALAVGGIVPRVVVPSLGGRFRLRRRSAEDLGGRLAAAGHPGGLNPGRWKVLKAISALTGLLLALAMTAVSPGRLSSLLAIAAPAGGFLAPDAWLARRSQRRLSAAIRDLPHMLELLRVGVEAGQAPGRALGMVAAEFDGPLAFEWRRASAQMSLGASQESALAELRQRLPCEEITSLCAALGRSSRHGVPLGRLLAALAARCRHHARQRVREQAARAGPKIQLAVALLLVPSVLLIVVAGLLAELERSGLGFGTGP